MLDDKALDDEVKQLIADNDLGELTDEQIDFIRNRKKELKEKEKDWLIEKLKVYL